MSHDRGGRSPRLVALIPARSGSKRVPDKNASLEIAWTRVVFDGRTIAGEVLMPFLTEDFEGFDVNQPVDWLLAERYLQTGQARLPHVPQVPYPGAAQGANPGHSVG